MRSDLMEGNFFTEQYFTERLDMRGLFGRKVVSKIESNKEYLAAVKFAQTFSKLHILPAVILMLSGE